jgi:hypothetical protein
VAEEQLTQDEFHERLEAELKRLKVSDVLLQMVYSVSSLGYRKLADEERDLEQARLAIESLRAVVPVLEGAVPAEAISELNQLRANLQLAYAKAVAETPGSGSEPQGPESTGQPPDASDEADDTG